MSSILITAEKILAKNFTFQIPWRYDGSAYNMINQKPTKTININEKGWQKKLKNERLEIDVVFVTADLEEEDYALFGEMPKLRSIYLYSARKLKSISFIESLTALRSLMICHSEVENLTPIKSLLELQNSDVPALRLNEVAIIDSKIRDISVFEKVGRFWDFILVDNPMEAEEALCKKLMRHVLN